MGSASGSPSKPAKKAVARVALVNLEEPSVSLVQEAFKQFEIECVVLDGDTASRRLHREKFEALAVLLDDRAHEILEATRSSPSNRRIVVFGVSDGTPLGLKFSRYGINTLLFEPLEKQKTLKAVRSAYLLILHELRRYVRIPLVMPVRVEAGHGRRFDSLSQEVSAGGMSLTSKEFPAKLATVEVAFTLPEMPKTIIVSSVCWRRERENLIGIRFDPGDDRRLIVREWIEDFLESD